MTRQLAYAVLPSLLALHVAAQLADTAYAGTLTGTVVGVTRAPDGHPLPKAEVIAHNSADSSADRTAVSASDGTYKLADLRPGRYEVTASKDGFRSVSAPILVAAAGNIAFDLMLADGAANVASGASPASVPSASAAIPAASGFAESKDVEALKQRIEQLESQLQALIAIQAREPATRPLLAKALPSAEAPAPQTPPAATAPPPAPAGVLPKALEAPDAGPAVDNDTPFAFGDFTWLNGTSRDKDTVLDTKFFTPEVRFDTEYMQSFNEPIDHTIVGATESFRSGEVQIEQASVGGDFHWDNVRGRILFMDGLFATTTPRNDASSATGSFPGNTGGVGQWDLQNAYKYVSEAYGGYHFNVQHGLNIDAGIFVSYIGLFSYYNFDNWTYQPSYVSSNTPWFFNGVRLQWFPTNKLKIEPWFINGWQSYAKFNGHPGLGGQLLWQPTEWFKLVANQYGFGEDNLGLPQTERIHTDDSIEIRFYNKPQNMGISKVAMSLTADAGCQFGGGITCLGAPSKNKDTFIGWMAYNRYWFHKDLMAITLGGGEMSNWGRYLTLLPPIDGAWAATGSAYFPELPGQRAHMWDSTVTFQYMPKEYLTWWTEAGYRHSDIPYFAGRGGVTPPGGDNGLPQYFTCNTGATAGTADLSAAQAACGSAGVWFPDLRRSEFKLSAGVMVRF
jgi:hypothetical protein